MVGRPYAKRLYKPVFRGFDNPLRLPDAPFRAEQHRILQLQPPVGIKEHIIYPVALVRFGSPCEPVHFYQGLSAGKVKPG